MKKVLAMGITGLILVVIGIAMFFMASSDVDSGLISVYFFNPTSMQMEAEARPMPEGELQILEVIRHLHSGPEAVALSSTWPIELAPQPEDLVSAVKLDGSTLFVCFTPLFHEMPPLGQSIFKAALIHTLSGMPAVSDLTIIVTDNYDHAFEMISRELTADDDDEPPYRPLIIYDNSHAGVLLSPLDPPISPQSITDHTFAHLHFADATGTGLVVESYLALNTNMQRVRRARYALELLIAGPRQEGAMALIPRETRVTRIEIDGIDIYVNLSGEFVSRFIGSEELANLMIQSIVQTLTEELHISHGRVHFLIEDQPQDEFHGVMYFNTPFMQDETLLLSRIEALAEAYEHAHEYEGEEE